MHDRRAFDLSDNLVDRYVPSYAFLHNIQNKTLLQYSQIFGICCDCLRLQIPRGEVIRLLSISLTIRDIPIYDFTIFLLRGINGPGRLEVGSPATPRHALPYPESCEAGTSHIQLARAKEHVKGPRSSCIHYYYGV